MKFFNAQRALLALLMGLGGHPLATQAATIDFDDMTPNLYLPEDSFTDSGYKLTVIDSFAQIDKAEAVSVPTLGNNSQFYFQAGDGGLQIEREDAGAFDVDSFSVAATPLLNAGNEPTVLVVFGTYMDNTFFGKIYDFAPPVDGAYPFASLSGGVELAGLKSALFFVCANDVDGGGVCFGDPRGNGQFALDDIQLSGVTPVPEPATVLFMGGGLLALAWRQRGQRIAIGKLGSQA